VPALSHHQPGLTVRKGGSGALSRQEKKVWRVFFVLDRPEFHKRAFKINRSKDSKRLTALPRAS
jgi:hypothetical protein